MRRIYLFSLAIGALLLSARGADGLVFPDLTLKPKQVAAALDGDWSDVRIAGRIFNRDPLGVVLSRAAGKITIRAFRGGIEGRPAPISRETAAAIISATKGHHETASAPGIPRSPSAIESPDEHPRRAPHMSIAITRKSVTKTRDVQFQLDAKPFARWLATTALADGSAPNH